MKEFLLLPGGSVFYFVQYFRPAAHRNVKLFISHGGLGSIMESKYYGVPVLGLPIFADQPRNVKMAADEGWALQLDFTTVTEEEVAMALDVLLKGTE